MSKASKHGKLSFPRAEIPVTKCRLVLSSVRCSHLP